MVIKLPKNYSILVFLLLQVILMESLLLSMYLFVVGDRVSILDLLLMGVVYSYGSIIHNFITSGVRYWFVRCIDIYGLDVVPKLRNWMLVLAVNFFLLPVVYIYIVMRLNIFDINIYDKSNYYFRVKLLNFLKLLLILLSLRGILARIWLLYISYLIWSFSV